MISMIYINKIRRLDRGDLLKTLQHHNYNYSEKSIIPFTTTLQ